MSHFRSLPDALRPSSLMKVLLCGCAFMISFTSLPYSRSFYRAETSFIFNMKICFKKTEVNVFILLQNYVRPQYTLISFSPSLTFHFIIQHSLDNIFTFTNILVSFQLANASSIPLFSDPFITLLVRIYNWYIQCSSKNPLFYCYS